MTPFHVRPTAVVAAASRNPEGIPPALRVWLLATIAVLAAWLLGSLVDRTGVAYGQTVPGAPQQVSTTAGNIQKRRPQLAADPVTGGVYMVWEEGSASTNTSNSNSNLFYAYRSPVTGNWTAPSQIVDNTVAGGAAGNYGGRWGAVGTLINETHAHIQVDSAGNLHVVYAAWRGNLSPGAYYTVGTAAATGAANWTAPVRLDMVSYSAATAGTLAAQDGTRLFVRDDPAGAAGVMFGYVLWAGNTGNDLRLTRVQYGPGHAVALPDAAPFSNGVDTSAGPVAVLEVDSDTLQLVYAGTNSDTGNGFWAWPVDLDATGVPSWAPPAQRASIAGVNGGECNAAGCTGATAVRDDLGNVIVAANYDVGGAHTIQVTSHDGTPGTPPAAADVATFASDTRHGRQPVIVYDLTVPTTMPIVLYNQCTWGTGTTSTANCAAKDISDRVRSGGVWGAANLTGNTTGEQQELTAVMVGDDLLYAWVGFGQTGSGTYHIFFHGVQSP
jgi:hypothetical protein